MVIYYRIVGPDGHVKVVFAGIEELDAGDALTITTALLSKLARDEIPLSKVMSFGSDGASVMTGHLTGVAARILRLAILHCYSLHLPSRGTCCQSGC